MTPTAGVDNYYYGNRIYSNGGLGVDLAPIGVNPNDPGDADSGPNDLMNFPVFTHLVTDGESTLIEGQIDSEPNTTLEITAYAVESCDTSGYGEGGGEGSQFNFFGNSITTDSNGIGIIAMSVGDYSAARPYIVMSTGFSEFSECKLIASGQNAGLAKLNIADTSQNEGDSGSTWMDFDITLDRTASITITVSYGMSNGSAQDGSDYNQSSGKISFPPGTIQQTIQVEILGDTDIEFHETFRVSLYAAVGAQIEDSQATGMILNDDGGGGGYYLFLPIVIR